MKGGDIEARARYVLDDAAAVGWTDDEFVVWVNDFCTFAQALRPDTCSVHAQITLVAGTKQSIASLDPVGLRLLDVIYNVTSGHGMSLVDRRTLDRLNPTWHRAAQASPTEYTYDDRDPTTFFVNPPSLASQVLDILYSRAPVKLQSAAELTTVELTIPDAYIDAAVNYVLFRLKSKESENAVDINTAAGYRVLAEQLLTGKLASDKAFSPRANTKHGSAAPVAGV